MSRDLHIENFIIWGASGHARVLLEIIERRGAKVMAIFDSNPEVCTPFDNLTVGHGLEAFDLFISSIDEPRAISAVAAIGGARGADRISYFELFRRSHLATPTLTHHTAWVSPSATIGDNCHILANASVSVGVEIGNCCVINTAASVDHECKVDDGVHVGPGARLAGCVHVAANTFIGAGAIVLPRIKIAENVIVGAGAVVTRDVPAGVVVVGNPARPIAGDGA